MNAPLRFSSATIPLSSFAKSDTASEYSVVKSIGTSSRASPSTAGPTRSVNMGTKPITCRIQWLGGADKFLVPRTPKLDNSALMIAQVENGQRPKWCEWNLIWLDEASECTIQPLYNSKQFVNGGQLSSIPAPIKLCKVEPPAGAVGTVAWSDVQEQWSCLMLLPNDDRISAQLDLDKISVNIVPGETPVTKNHMWRIQVLKEGAVSAVNIINPGVLQPPKPIASIALLKGTSSPLPFEIRCRLITGKNKALVYLDTDDKGCLIFVRTNSCASPALWTIKQFGKFYTIQLVKNQKYLSDSPAVGLSTILAKWTIEDFPYAPGGTSRTTKSSSRCTIRPAARQGHAFRADSAKPAVIKTPSSKKKKLKWKVEVPSESLPTPSSSNVAGNKNQAPVQPTTPQTHEEPDDSASESADTICSTTGGRNSTISQPAPPTPTPRDISEKPADDGVPAPEKVDSKERVTDWVKNLADIPANPPGFRGPAATPVGEPQPESPIAQVTLPTNVNLPIGAKMCRVQHVLTGAFLSGTGKSFDLTERASANNWVVKPWGPGYTFSACTLRNPDGSPQYLAPDPDNDGKTLLPSPYPATWEITEKQERYTSAANAEEMEWICKIRWPFTEERIRVDGPSKDSKGLKVRLSENNGSDELDRLSEYWRVQFLVA